MWVYVGFDDTDTATADRGIGKLARWFERELPEGCRLWGVVQQQLLLDDAIPYTSHKSSACAILDCPEQASLDLLAARAVACIERHFIEGTTRDSASSGSTTPLFRPSFHLAFNTLLSLRPLSTLAH